jgi:hypothetical protein
MRHILIVLCLLFGSVTTANAQVSINFVIPSVSIGVNVGGYPELVRVPDYPVYYAPRLGFNFFFYDGLYWAYQRDEWYASYWYNGPWGMVDRMAVPYFILRVPVRYYRDPPQYFRGWRQDAPPRWGQHWGNQWQDRRRDWDKWDRKSAPPPAPLPVYQRQYSGDRYPRVEQQQELHNKNYRYQPREAVVRESYKQQAAQRKPVTSQQQEKGKGASQEKAGGRQDSQRSDPTPPRSQPQQKSGQREQPVQKGSDDARRPAPAPQKGSADRDQGRQQQGAGQREQQNPRAIQEGNRQDKGASQDAKRRQDKDNEDDREKGGGKGQDRNR